MSAPVPPTQPEVDPEMQYMHAQFAIFQARGLRDQQAFYRRALDKYNRASDQVNRLRALLGLITGLVAGFSGLIVAINLGNAKSCLANNASLIANPADCGLTRTLVLFLMFISVVAPALAAALNILNDLYQWNRLIEIYTTAVENIEVAEANQPKDKMDVATYRAYLRAYSQGTLRVMADETAQWGQMIRKPEGTAKFLDEALQKTKDFTGFTVDPSDLPPKPPPTPRALGD